MPNRLAFPPQEIREWVAVIAVAATIAGFAIWLAWSAVARFIEDLKRVIDSVWRDRR